MQQRPARDASGILHDATETLNTAELGLTLLLGEDPRQRLPGLRNVVVFGRAVTNVLQNLRSVRRQDFDAWYLPISEQMEQDELLKYFYRLRNQILKEGSLGPVSTRTHIKYLDTRELQPLMQNPPQGARGFFIGDPLGGSGWEVVLPDGTIEKYYIALPEHLQIDLTFRFADPPTTHLGQQLSDTSIQALARHYVDYLRRLVREAKDRFG